MIEHFDFAQCSYIQRILVLERIYMDIKNALNKYDINIFYSEEDKGFIAKIVNVPELEYNSAFGLTREEAVRELEWAIRSIIEIRVEKGLDIPKASHSLKHS